MIKTLLQAAQRCLLLLALMVAPALAGQSSYTMPTTGPMSLGTFVGTYLNPALAAALSCNSGNSAPAVTGQPAAYQCWIDTSTTPKTYKIYDGTSWVTIGTVDTTGHQWVSWASALKLPGSSSGTITITPQAAAGTATLTLPNASGTFAVSAATPLALSSTTGGLSITGAAGQVLAGAGPAFTATPTLGVAGSTLGTLTLAGSTSGTTVLQPNVAASGTLTLPAATDTLVGKATTDTLTNKTLDTAGAGNVLKINGTTVSSVTGSGAVVLGTSPSLSTPSIGSAGATFAGSTSGSTTVAASATASGTLTLPAATDTLVGKATTDTLTNKTLDTAGAGNVLKINGTTVSSVTGSGAVVLGTSPSLTTPAIGSAGATFAGSTSGTTAVAASATASGTLTLPAATDTLVGKATTDTLTNKTFDTAGAGNVFKINGTQITANTGTGSNVLATSPTLVTPNLGTPSAATLTNATGLPVATGVSGLGTGVATALTTPSSANLATAVTDETGSGALVFATSPTLVTPALGTPSSGTLTNATGLPISTGVSGLGSGVATALATPSSANLATAITDETGSGSIVFGTSPTLATPVLNGTPTGTGVATGATASTVALRDSNANLTANSLIPSYATTVTAAGTTTLTVSSPQLQYFTGTTTQTVQLPVVSTLVLGQSYTIVNNSSGAVTVNSSGGNLVLTVASGNTAIFTVIATTGTTATSWSNTYISSGAGTGTVTSVTCGTGLSGGTFSTAGTCALTTPVAVGNGGTGISSLGTGMATWWGTPSSANLAATVTDETGSGALVFGTSPSLTTPTIGSAGENYTGSTSGTTTLKASATASGTLTLPAATDTLIGKATTDTLTNKTFDTAATGNSFKINGTAISAVTGSGSAVLATSPTLVTPALGTPASGVLTNATGLPLTTGVTGTLGVANGGTGATSLTANNVLLGNGTSAVQVVAPGTSGNVLTSDGTTWTSSAPASGSTYAQNTSDLTRTSSTLANVTGLSFSVSANTSYRFSFVARITGSGSSSAGVKLAVTSPSSPTRFYYTITMIPLTSAVIQGSSISSGGAVGGSLGANDEVVAVVDGGLVNGANAGNIQLQYAQNTTNANAITFRSGGMGILDVVP